MTSIVTDSYCWRRHIQLIPILGGVLRPFLREVGIGELLLPNFSFAKWLIFANGNHPSSHATPTKLATFSPPPEKSKVSPSAHLPPYPIFSNSILVPCSSIRRGHGQLDELPKQTNLRTLQMPCPPYMVSVKTKVKFIIEEEVVGLLY